jgi:tight adherence protein C
VPTEAVKEFVSSVIQAEEKGNPLSEVLRIQARMLRMRRSVAAEQNASRAGLMMMIPLLLIFASIILLLLGPFIINGMKSGF